MRRSVNPPTSPDPELPIEFITPPKAWV